MRSSKLDFHRIFSRGRIAYAGEIGKRAASVNDIIITAKWSLSRLQGNIGGEPGANSIHDKQIDRFFKICAKAQSLPARLG